MENFLLKILTIWVPTQLHKSVSAIYVGSYVACETRTTERGIPEVCLTAQTWASCHRIDDGLGDRAMRRSETHDE